jgi:hypothetical protein
MDKPMVFIGSSKEGVYVARAIKKQFDRDADVYIWDENVFHLDKHNLGNLMRMVNLCDFGILVYTADDEVISRGHSQQAPRDNVLFEHGLLTGRLGLNRTFFIFEEGVKLPSDFSGITAASFRKRHDGDLTAAVGTACNRIRQAMQAQMERAEISFSPSTLLAVGYFNNYIHRLAIELEESRGKPINITMQGRQSGVELSYEDYVIRILIPDALSEIEPEGMIRGVRELVRANIESRGRAIEFYVKESEIEITRTPLLEVFSKPRLLLVAREAINAIAKFSDPGAIGRNDDQKRLEKREIRNFEKTMAALIEERFGARTPHIKLCRIETLSEWE